MPRRPRTGPFANVQRWPARIFNNVSYFNALGDPSPLTHFWSLAIGEQFYLIWPPVLLVLLRFGARRRVMLVLAIASGAATTLLYNPAEDLSRLYYGTDTHKLGEGEAS